MFNLSLYLNEVFENILLSCSSRGSWRFLTVFIIGVLHSGTCCCGEICQVRIRAVSIESGLIQSVESLNIIYLSGTTLTIHRFLTWGSDLSDKAEGGKIILLEAHTNPVLWFDVISSLIGRAEATPSDPMFKISCSPWSMIIMRRVHTVTSINNSVLSNINCWWLTSSWSSNIFNRDRNVLSNNTSKSKLDLISSANDLNHETWRRKVQFITRHILQSPVSINPTCHEYHTPHPPPYLDLTVVRRKLQPQSGLSPLIVACTCLSSISVCMIAR